MKSTTTTTLAGHKCNAKWNITLSIGAKTGSSTRSSSSSSSSISGEPQQQQQKQQQAGIVVRGNSRRANEAWTLFICLLASFTLLHSSKLIIFHDNHDNNNNNNNLHHDDNTVLSSYDSGYDNSILNGDNDTSTISLLVQQHQHQQANLASSISTAMIARRNNKKARVLMGIFSADAIGQSRYRDAFRTTLKMHPKVCKLHDYIYGLIPTSVREECELIYTFVLCGGSSTSPTEIVSYQENLPVILLSTKQQQQQQQPKKSFFSNDINENDITFLNIRENKNEGKSQTWFYYASLAMSKYGIEYAMKMDSDSSLIYLDRYFAFADHSLPPAPYNNRIIAGTALNKVWWNQKADSDTKLKESFFYKHYSTMHLYPAGTMYILSKDLVHGVVDIAANSRREATTYMENVEEHDISLFAFMAAKLEKDKPIKFVIIPYKNPWWRSDLSHKNGVSAWKKAWDEEITRMKNLYLTKGDGKQHPILTNDESDKNTFPTDEEDKDIQQKEILRTTRTKMPSLPRPNITLAMRREWREHIASSNMEKLAHDIHKLDLVQINNTIAPSDSCFLEYGYLQKALRIVQFTAEGGKHWSDFASLVKERIPDPDIIILNQMDLSMSRSGNIHATEMLAVELRMNYAWGMELIDLNGAQEDNAQEDEHGGFSGHAILSKCQLYDPLIVRDPPDNEDIMDYKLYGSRIGLFVRTGYDEDSHLVIGSAQKIDPMLHKEEIWQYQFGHESTNGLFIGTPPTNQIGTILAGEIDRQLCTQSGLANLDKTDHVTFPVDCSIGDHGSYRTDNFCGNLMRNMDQQTDSYHLPCIRRDQGLSDVTQISKHSIIDITLQ